MRFFNNIIIRKTKRTFCILDAFEKAIGNRCLLGFQKRY